MVNMWQPLDRSNALTLLWPDGFEEMGIKSGLYAAGICDAANVYGYYHHADLAIVIFLLWKAYPSAAEAKIWINRHLPRTALLQATEEVKIMFREIGVKYIFIACNHWPLYRVANALGATARQLRVGTLYEWEFD